jgi:hypothetical protein
MLSTDWVPSAVQPGTNVLVSGPSGHGARDVALQLVLSELAPDEAVILISADVGGRPLLQRAADIDGPIDRTRIGVVDCSGLDDDQARFREHGEPIDDPGYLMNIEMEFSVLYETLVERGYDRVYLAVFSVSSLLAHADLQSVSWFLHMLTGRIPPAAKWACSSSTPRCRTIEPSTPSNGTAMAPSRFDTEFRRDASSARAASESGRHRGHRCS